MFHFPFHAKGDMFGGVAFGGFEIAPLPFRATLDDTGCNFLDLFPACNAV